MKKTLFDKIWEKHVVHERQDGSSLIYIDRHLVHEVTSPQAFEGLRNSNRPLRRPKVIPKNIDIYIDGGENIKIAIITALKKYKKLNNIFLLYFVPK